ATDLSIAYLEDPGSKRVTGYRVGDAIAGGTLTVIAPDHIVLKRSDGMVDVPLRDPAKPRAAAPEPAQPAGGPPSPATATPGGFPQPQMPGPVPGLPPLPPASLGPRGGAPEAPGAPSPAPAGERRPTPAPPIAPPVPAAQRGRFVVLNFDNADVETVVHAASEILGFNYVLAPDVRGKVTV